VRSIILKVLASAAIAISGHASAATYSYVFSEEFSGADEPGGATPWATLSFADVAGGVSMSLSLASTMESTAFAGAGYFNFGGTAAQLTALTFSYGSGQALPTIGKAFDSFKADGDGWFDIRFLFPTDQGDDRFLAGESLTYMISGGGVTADLFNYTSAPGGGNGTWHSALHMQGLGQDAEGSGWIGATPTTPVPEPETYAMLLAGLALMGFVARRRRERSAVSIA
jgi:hypothetical protein